MVSVSEIRKAQRSEGPATILAIGTANPANCVEQSTYPDFYHLVVNPLTHFLILPRNSIKVLAIL